MGISSSSERVSTSFLTGGLAPSYRQLLQQDTGSAVGRADLPRPGEGKKRALGDRACWVRRGADEEGWTVEEKEDQHDGEKEQKEKTRLERCKERPQRRR